MTETYPTIIDANINRVSEGLRVIEEYTRFIAQHKPLTDQLATLRKQVNQTESYQQKTHHLAARNTTHDMRAMDPPTQRKNTFDILKANFKRIEEGLRVLEEYTGNPQYNMFRYACYELEKNHLSNPTQTQNQTRHLSHF